MSGLLLASVWTNVVAPAVTLAAALIAVVSVGWAEGRRLGTQYRFDQRRQVRDLVGQYRGLLLEAAVDWDTAMTRLYASREELDSSAVPSTSNGLSVLELHFQDQSGLNSHNHLGSIYTKYLSSTGEHVFRSYVYRLVAICAIARRFEAEALWVEGFYSRSMIARSGDLAFLKLSKSFLWAITTSDLPDESGFPSVDHIPIEVLRPLLDRCYKRMPDDPPSGTGQREVVFDLDRLDALVEAERQKLQEQASTRESVGVDVPLVGFGQVLMLLLGLHKPDIGVTEGTFRRRLIWDRLCVLHLLAMAFIDEFGYPYQQHDKADFQRTVTQITDLRSVAGFAKALRAPLALLPDNRRPVGHRSSDQAVTRSLTEISELLRSRLDPD